MNKNEVAVFGAADTHEQENIGSAIVARMRWTHGWNVHSTDCRAPSGMRNFYVPNSDEWPYESCDAIVISLGRSFSVSFGDFPDAELEDVIRANLTLPLQVASRYIHERQRQRNPQGGKIVFIGSYGHDHAFTGGTPYTAAKAGLNQAVKNIAWETTALGFRTFIVNPFHVTGTPMWDKVLVDVEDRYSMSPEAAKAYTEKDAKMPLLKPKVVAKAVSSLLVDDTFDHLSGNSINLYGGTR